MILLIDPTTNTTKKKIRLLQVIQGQKSILAFNNFVYFFVLKIIFTPMERFSFPVCSL
jgi:hypothetical protein